MNGARGDDPGDWADDWDEDDVRVRPARRTRPRTKLRPAHAKAVDAFVTTVDRGRYTCLVTAAGRRRPVLAMRARELHRQQIVVGDEVSLVGDVSGRDGTLARIVRIAPRRSVLRRSADDADPTERIQVANADALLIVTAAADPPPRVGFIDRCLVAAYAGRLDPLLLVTKTDLADPAALLARYAGLDVRVFTSAQKDERLDAEALERLRAVLTNRITALVGHSGVGKSTLVNALVPAAERATGEVTGVGKGRHTSSSAVALPLPEGGWIIDTPGVRSFGLAHVTDEDVIAAFEDLGPATADCPPGCHHGVGAIGCALDGVVARGEAGASRLASLRRLLASRGDGGDEGGGDGGGVGMDGSGGAFGGGGGSPQ